MTQAIILPRVIPRTKNPSKVKIAKTLHFLREVQAFRVQEIQISIRRRVHLTNMFLINNESKNLVY